MGADAITEAYCGPPPLPQEILARWTFDPVLIAAFATAAVLLAQHSHGRWRGAAAWAVLFILFVSPLCAMTVSLFSMRSLHHVLLTALAAPLAASMIRTALPSHPAMAFATAALHALVLWAWHVPSLYAAALSNDLIYWLMQAMLFGSAVAIWHAMRSAAPPLAILAALFSMMQMGLLGALLTFAPQPLYAPHFGTAMAWGVTPLEDQQLAGLLMWILGAGAYLAAALAVASRLFPKTKPMPASC